MFGFVYLLIFQFREPQQPAAVSLLMLLCVRNSSPLLEVDVLARPYELTPLQNFQGKNVRITNGGKNWSIRQVSVGISCDCFQYIYILETLQKSFILVKLSLLP
jgi:hypothetical protein